MPGGGHHNPALPKSAGRLMLRNSIGASVEPACPSVMHFFRIVFVPYPDRRRAGAAAG